MFKIVFENLMLARLIIGVCLAFFIVINDIKSPSKNQKDHKAKEIGKNYNGNANQERLYDSAPEKEELKPRITINRETSYRPEQMSKPLQFPGKTMNPQNDDRRYLIFEKQAYTKLKDGLDWGRKTRRNCVEQGGILLGKAAFYDNEIYCFVKDILLADTLGNPVFVEISSEMWATMQDRLDEINASLDGNKKLAIVGWFHTHPNNLAVFMSGTDMKTQRLNFSQKWQVSLVMNPHTDRYRAFFGASAIDGEIVFQENPR